MNGIKLEVRSDVSKKTGNTYKYVAIVLPNGYTLRVFLKDAEMYLLELALSTK